MEVINGNCNDCGRSRKLQKGTKYHGLCMECADDAHRYLINQEYPNASQLRLHQMYIYFGVPLKKTKMLMKLGFFDKEYTGE